MLGQQPQRQPENRDCREALLLQTTAAAAAAREETSTAATRKWMAAPLMEAACAGTMKTPSVEVGAEVELRAVQQFLGVDGGNQRTVQPG